MITTLTKDGQFGLFIDFRGIKLYAFIKKSNKTVENGFWHFFGENVTVDM